MISEILPESHLENQLEKVAFSFTFVWKRFVANSIWIILQVECRLVLRILSHNLRNVINIHQFPPSKSIRSWNS